MLDITNCKFKLKAGFRMIALRLYLRKYPQLTLIFSILLLYVPFYSEPILRPSGDEKVYIAQALEMKERGTWFLQWLAGEQNYHKGPAFYLLLRIGFIIFGTSSMWSVLYMNLLGLLISALFIEKIFKKYLQKSSGISLFASLSYAYSVGMYFHMFASQMEALQVSFYAISLCFLYLSEYKESRTLYHFGLWLSIGFLGLLKSPIYSVLPGLSVLLVWFLRKKFIERLANLKVLACVGSGVLLVMLGFAPAFFLDQENFINTYIIRETLSKGPNSVPWYASALPPFTLYLFPWVLPGITCFILAIWLIFRRKIEFTSEEGLFLKCCVLFALPTIVFFTFHPYRSEVYTLPIISCTLSVFAILMGKPQVLKNSCLQLSFITSGFAFVFLCAAIVFLHFSIDPFPSEWWPSWLTISFITLTALSLVFLHRSIKNRYLINLTGLAISPIPFFIALALFLNALGKRDFMDFSSNIEQIESHNVQNLAYLNMPRHTWSEWGALNMWLHHPVRGIHKMEELKKLVEMGGVLIVPERSITDFIDLLHRKFESVDYKINKIRRWMVHGKTQKGDMKTLEYFIKTGNLKDLERYDYWISF